MAFVPDFTLLKETAWDAPSIHARCRELAALFPGSAIVVDDTRYQYASLGDYVREGREMVEPLDAIVVENDVRIQVALGWHAGKRELRALVNGSPTDGVHVDAMRAAIQQALATRIGRRIARKRIERQLVAVLHVWLDHPRFENPMQDWLVNPEVSAAVKTVVERELARYFETTPAALDALLLALG